MPRLFVKISTSTPKTAAMRSSVSTSVGVPVATTRPASTRTMSRALTERHCEKDALPLAAREGVHLALCKCGDVRGLHRPRDCLAILRVRMRLKEPCVGKASIRNELLYREPLRRRTLLRQDGAHARELLFRVAAKLAPIEHDRARVAGVQPRKRA